MTNNPDLLERTVEKVRELPAVRLRVLDEFIDELQESEAPYVLSDEKLAILEAAAAEVDAGRYATEAEVAHAFRRVAK